MSVIEMSRAIVRKNVVIEGESAAHERYVRARVVRKQKRPSTLIATITIRGVRVQTLIARFFSTTAKTLTTKGEEVIQSRERERKNSITNNKRERERERETSSKRFREALSLFFAYRYDRVDRFLRRRRLGDDSDASKLGGGERKHFL